MEDLLEIPEPVANILIKKIPFEKVVMTANGAYYHHADVVSAIKEYRKECLVAFLDSIKNYEHEAGKRIHDDDRDSSEIVEIFLSIYTCENKKQ